MGYLKRSIKLIGPIYPNGPLVGLRGRESTIRNERRDIATQHTDTKKLPSNTMNYFMPRNVAP